jgi:hypothetical protein
VVSSYGDLNLNPYGEPQVSKIAFSQNLVNLKSFAKRGNEEAAVVSAMLDLIKVMAITTDAEGDTAANTIRVSIQVTDMDGTPIAAVSNILATSVPESGAGTMTVGTVGTAKAGSGSTQAWFQTDANGALEIDVLNAAAEDNLLVLGGLDDSMNESLVLTFA